ncbi:MAG: hypothetical protein ACAH95_01835 [Fimbriimonas sp.]
MFAKHERTDTIVWTCDPLLVVDAAGNVVYSEKTDVEFMPEEGTAACGLATAIKRNAAGEEPMIKVRQRFDEPSMIYPYPSRGGFMLMGEDMAGNEVTWYVDKSADNFLTAD